MERMELIRTVSHSGDSINQDYELAEDMAGLMVISAMKDNGEATNLTLGCVAQLKVDSDGMTKLDLRSSGITDIADISAFSERFQCVAGDNVNPGLAYIPFPQLKGKILRISASSLAAADTGSFKIYAVYNGKITETMTSVRIAVPLAAATQTQIPKFGYLDHIKVPKTVVITENIAVNINGYPARPDEEMGAYLTYKPISAAINTPQYVIPIGNDIGLNSHLYRPSASGAVWYVHFVFINSVGSANTSAKDSGSVLDKQPASRAKMPFTGVDGRPPLPLARPGNIRRLF